MRCCWLAAPPRSWCVFSRATDEHSEMARRIWKQTFNKCVTRVVMSYNNTCIDARRYRIIHPTVLQFEHQMAPFITAWSPDGANRQPFSHMAARFIKHLAKLYFDHQNVFDFNVSIFFYILIIRYFLTFILSYNGGIHIKYNLDQVSISYPRMVAMTAYYSIIICRWIVCWKTN